MNTKHNLRLGIVLGGVIAAVIVGCVGGARGGPKTGSAESRVLSPAAEKELTFSDTQLAIVFAIDGNGQIQPFRRQGTEPVAYQLPLPAQAVEMIEGITVIRTKNPKVCWTMTNGDRACVSW